jgi:uncharacterized alpha-E superfamily protein
MNKSELPDHLKGLTAREVIKQATGNLRALRQRMTEEQWLEAQGLAQTIHARDNPDAPPMPESINDMAPQQVGAMGIAATYTMYTMDSKES